MFGLSLLQLALAIITLMAAIAPLFIWRGVNRTNRLLALQLHRLGVDPGAVKEAWYAGGAELPSVDSNQEPRRP
jgi:ABC-type transport system involved in cytochrome c biogenesis permease subunit